MWPDEKISELILKTLAGEASPEEENRLAEWRKSNLANEEEYQHILEIWETSGRITSSPSPVNVDAEWEKFRLRHFKAEPNVFRLNVRLVMRYVAVLIIGLLGGIWYFSGSVSYTSGAGERLVVELSDGSTILLAENTTLEVPRTYNWQTRKLNLAGEAFFEVASNPEKPFVAKGSKTSLRVLGTAFRMVATERENTVEVSEGKVAYWSTHRDTVILTRNQSGVLSGTQMQSRVITDQNYDSWQSGSFRFKDKILVEVLHQLQNFYVFDLKDPGGKLNGNCTFTGQFKGQNLEDVLQELALVTGLKYELNENILTIENLSCQ